MCVRLELVRGVWGETRASERSVGVRLELVRGVWG